MRVCPWRWKSRLCQSSPARAAFWTNARWTACEQFEAEMLEFIQAREPDIFKEISEKKVITAELEQKLQARLKEFCGEFKKANNP